MQESEDILAAFEIQEKQTQPQKTDTVILHIKEITEEKTQPLTKNKSGVFHKISDSLLFLVKYLTTSACIFGILMLATNYSAYWNLATSIIYAEEMEVTKKSLIESVAAASVEENQDPKEKKGQDTFKQLSEITTQQYEYTPSMHSYIKNGS
jgi:hypothetical protein